jgi:predicted hydrocarbon binding protein
MHSKELLCEVREPGAHLVEFVVTLRNSPGVIGRVSSVIGGLEINILSGFHAALPTEREGMWSFFAELTDKTTPEQVVEAIKGVDAVVDASFLDMQLPGLIIDEVHFPLFVLDERAVVFRLGMLRAMFKHLQEMIGERVTRVLRHQMGLEAGEAKARRVQEQFHLTGEDALRVILAERVAKGWGIPTLLKYDPANQHVLILVTELFECTALEKEGTEPTGDFFRGYLQGALRVLMNNDVQVHEIECVAKGHPRCSFEATKTEAQPP